MKALKATRRPFLGNNLLGEFGEVAVPIAQSSEAVIIDKDVCIHFCEKEKPINNNGYIFVEKKLLHGLALEADVRNCLMVIETGTGSTTFGIIFVWLLEPPAISTQSIEMIV